MLLILSGPSRPTPKMISTVKKNLTNLRNSGAGRREVDEHRRGHRAVLQKLRGRVDDGVLAPRVIRHVERVTVLEWNKKRPRRADALGHFANELNHHSRDALAFQLGRDQTHGLVAHRSN